MDSILNNTGDILIYQNEKGDTKVDVYFSEDTIWMTQQMLSKLYQTTPQNITYHIKNIYEDGELLIDSTCKDYLQVQLQTFMDKTGQKSILLNPKQVHIIMIQTSSREQGCKKDGSIEDCPRRARGSKK